MMAVLIHDAKLPVPGDLEGVDPMRHSRALVSNLLAGVGESRSVPDVAIVLVVVGDGSSSLDNVLVYQSLHISVS